MEQEGRSRGCPRDQIVDRKVLSTAIRLAQKHGVRAVSLELIAESSGVAKTTLYRRWRNGPAIWRTPFCRKCYPTSLLPTHRRWSAYDSRRTCSRPSCVGEWRMLRSLLSEVLVDARLQRALRERWIAPRRASAESIIRNAIAAKELPQNTTPTILLDTLYGGLYYWLLFEPARLTADYIGELFSLVLQRATQRQSLNSKQCELNGREKGAGRNQSGFPSSILRRI
jgi:hypothetical protein